MRSTRMLSQIPPFTAAAPFGLAFVGSPIPLFTHLFLRDSVVVEAVDSGCLGPNPGSSAHCV